MASLVAPSRGRGSRSQLCRVNWDSLVAPQLTAAAAADDDNVPDDVVNSLVAADAAAVTSVVTL